MKRGYVFILLIFWLSSCGINKSLKDRPILDAYNKNISAISVSSDTFSLLDDNQLRRNKFGLYELYVAGDPLERGLITGALTQSLLQKQEHIFFGKIQGFVPSESKQKFLRFFLKLYNRKIHLHIPNQYKAEIYGISQYASDKFDHIAGGYHRSLYLHGAHDIGHALQDLALVGCSSFAAWDDKTEDGSMIVARNFDFYVGDDFAEDKIIAFIDPEVGHKFMSITWGGMIGLVSGMNDQGLTVTINAGKSSIPWGAKTPIAILNREILQYASTIEEAIIVARRRDVFVSESIFIASAKDRRAVTIEVSPKKFDVYEVPNSNQLICANHFQSKAYADDHKNKKHIIESHSKYRYDRMTELLDANPKVTPQIAVDILRNREGLNDKKIGYGNEKALNQLLAHHGIVFKPEEGLVWISTNPYQMGEFVAYDMNAVFDKFKNKNPSEAIYEPSLTIEKDSFIFTEAFKQYEAFRNMRRDILEDMENEQVIPDKTLNTFKSSNPDYWEAYYIVGNYYYNQKNYSAAIQAFETALTKEITTVPDVKATKKLLKKAKRKNK